MEGIENKESSTENTVVEDKSKKRNGWDDEGTKFGF